MKNPVEPCIDVQKVRLRCLIDLGLNFSAMLRLYKKGSKEKFYNKVLSEIPSLLQSENEEQFQMAHSSICEWGVKNLLVNEGSGYASYGQIAKTLDVILKVVIDYGHMPDCYKAKQMSPWLNSAVDNKMMNMLKKNYPNVIKPWPSNIRQVNREKYLVIQSLVRRFNTEKYNNRITPVQFDDIYWWCLNKRGKYEDKCVYPPE
ncbi:hypothetical protein MUP77_10345 [Candidatus Bathyarchaeota archaeon]|nr:hypothetical protein [Candidatus Bathyarchaeota archaeon]